MPTAKQRPGQLKPLMVWRLSAEPSAGQWSSRGIVFLCLVVPPGQIRRSARPR
jgi:hypothetical protein